MQQRLKGGPFGHVEGRPAQLFVLDNGVLRACITDYGGSLVSLEAPDRQGRLGHVVLGFDDAAHYAESKGSFGALLGRNANRIAGGRVTVDGRRYELSKNESEATLHGGAAGFGKRFWSVEAVSTGSLTLTLTSADGDQGFPGEVHAQASYRLQGPTLWLTLEARSTKATPLSLSAHPYFNLEGPAAQHCLDHEIVILADVFLPTDQNQIPTGDMRLVEGTAFDFRAPRRIGERIREPDLQLRYGRGYDHYFVLAQGAAASRPRLAARVHARTAGRVLELFTTQRGVQFYTGNQLNGWACGRDGLYRQSAGFALEPQGFPNAANQPNFPSTLLRPGKTYHEEIVYRLRTDAQSEDPCGDSS